MSDPDKSLHTTEMKGYVRGWRDGDPVAADGLVRRAGNRFRRLARRMYRGFPNVHPLAESADVVQDSWARLLQTLRNLEPASMSAFYQLAAVHVRRELIDLARHAQSNKFRYTVPIRQAAGDGSGGGVAAPAAEGDDPDDFDLWVRFHEAVDHLDPDHRKLVGLVFYQGMSKFEAAELIGVNPRTVGRWWAAAMVELRERVGGRLPPPG